LDGFCCFMLPFGFDGFVWGFGFGFGMYLGGLAVTGTWGRVGGGSGGGVVVVGGGSVVVV